MCGCVVSGALSWGHLERVGALLGDWFSHSALAVHNEWSLGAWPRGAML